MENHRVVSRDQWIEERTALLAKEKEFTRLRDQLSRERRELPWVRSTGNMSSKGQTANKPWASCSPEDSS
jgi:predicted dithiol-disulfide oxidoreductase (DUF899 family)